ncbi:MAG: hypothetical protein CMF96_10315 [Candidatus Marinimicrobia bacterium]|nr:hypothetical protein [Candidatus Neomarinimicrobiota bacterium]|tara:strand:+ start:15765 stop:16673 length:909 start_codon:yes stop_codon:yes gene_type:complete
MNKKVAIIDLGTNSLITTIAEKIDNKIKILNENYQIIRLGEGLAETGNISNSAILRCISGFRKVKEILEKFNVHIITCIATSALRDAQNKNKIIQILQIEFNIRVQVISGIKEAEIVTNATRREFNLKNKNTLIFDIGGGSTEVIILQNNVIKISESFKIGAVRCTESFLKSDPPNMNEIKKFENYLDTIIAKLPNFKVEEGIGIAGTVTTLSSINLNMSDYNPNIIHKSCISDKEVEDIKIKFQNLNLKQKRKIKGLDSKRAEVILAGTIICKKIMNKYKLDKIFVSDRGLRWGLLYQEFS